MGQHMQIMSPEPYAVEDEAQLLAELEAARAAVEPPYAKARIDVVARACAPLLRQSSAKRSPGAVHFAFWTRLAALHSLKAEFERGLPSGCSARPRGLVFHLPPQNVETVFLYSWVLSYLAGNANVVRLPTSLSDEMNGILELLLGELAKVGDHGQRFVRYPAGSALSAKISSLSDARIVWGGDAKIATFAGTPLRHGGKSLWFGDRFSFSVLYGPALAALGAAERRDLAARFVNDVFVFDQMACSSPHALYVVGTRGDHEAALLAFFAEVADSARDKAAIATGHAMHKLTSGFAALGAGHAQRLWWDHNALTAVESGGDDRLETRIGGGYLQYRFVDRLDALRPLVREHDQTLTYFGFDPGQMEAFVAPLTSGLTRVAPFGQALDFSFVWDGYDLPRELTRLVRVT
jgi:hypothetical protein